MLLDFRADDSSQSVGRRLGMDDHQVFLVVVVLVDFHTAATKKQSLPSFLVTVMAVDEWSLLPSSCHRRYHKQQ
jgi:hypothetical protein